jgi:CheY-like chemotaxis protein
MKAIRPDVPIIAFTVLTDPEVRKEMREAGITTVLGKPSELEQIATVLWQVIRTGKR